MTETRISLPVAEKNIERGGRRDVDVERWSVHRPTGEKYEAERYNVPRFMPFEHACFVSYRHAGPATDIVAGFCEKLAAQLALYTNYQIFRDRKRLAPGDYLDNELATAMCRSSCMVLLFTPHYFDLDHPYCAREYQAMLELERRRRPMLAPLQGKSLIIPVIMRGESRVPAELKASVCVSFEDRLLQTSNLRRQNVLEDVLKIAKAIHERIEAMQNVISDPAADCSSFRFPNTEDIRPWLQQIVRPPLGNPTRERL